MLKEHLFAPPSFPAYRPWYRHEHLEEAPTTAIFILVPYYVHVVVVVLAVR